MLVFFATLGASANVADAARMGGAVGLFVALQLGLHLAITLGLGWLLRLPLRLVRRRPPVRTCRASQEESSLLSRVFVGVQSLINHAAHGLNSAPQVLVASNANVGGPATAAAMASSKGWHDLVQPAVLMGCLGYVLGTPLGVSMGMFLKSGTLLSI